MDFDSYPIFETREVTSALSFSLDLFVSVTQKKTLKLSFSHTRRQKMEQRMIEVRNLHQLTLSLSLWTLITLRGTFLLMHYLETW